MTGYQSKKKAARDKIIEVAKEGMSMHSPDAPEYIVCEALIEALAQPEQEPVARVIDNGTPEGVTEWIPFTNRVEPLKTGDFLYTTPPQRQWVGLTEGEWFEWWRVSPVADATEAEIDFADFLIIAQAVMTKLKELNNG